MVQQEITFNDGSHIFYRKVNGITRRFIEYAYSPYQREQLKKDPNVEEWYRKQQRKFIAYKYYYLNILWSIACVRNESQRQQLYNELKELHDKVGTEYDDSILNKGFLDTFGKYFEGEEMICEAFFATIYLSMLDHEEGKLTNPNSLGKTKVLKACEAVILGNTEAWEAAIMIDMEFKDIIDKAIREEGIIEFDYSKDGESNKYYQLRNIRYSDEYGKKFICGCPINSDKELTFKIERIKDIQLMWDFIFEENIPIEKDGIYAVAFMADNYVDFGLYSYEVGLYLLNRCELELIDLLAYHYIPFYTEIDNKRWFAFNKTEKAKEDSIYVFAYTMKQGISVDLEERFDFLLSGYSFQTTEHSEIHYTAILVRKGDGFENKKLNEGVKILAYSRCPNYSYHNLGVHNDIRLGLKP